MDREPKIGEAVIWHESDGTPANALITAVWGPKCINVVIVSVDVNKQDNYGRQTERRTSCSHKTLTNVHGFYWRFPEEEPNPYVPPTAI